MVLTIFLSSRNRLPRKFNFEDWVSLKVSQRLGFFLSTILFVALDIFILNYKALDIEEGIGKILIDDFCT